MTESPLRILIVSMWPSAVAPERGVFVQRQVEALRELGHDVTVAALTDVRTGPLQTPLKYLRLFGRALWLALRLRPDVIHAHYLLPTGWVARLVSWLSRTPYVVFAHGTDVRNATQSARIRRLTSGVVRDAATVVAVSHQLAGTVRELYPGVEVDVADVGVDERLFVPGDEAAPQPQAPPVFVTVGSLLPNKNHVRLLAALAQLDGARLQIVGAGPLEPKLRERVHELQLAERVEFLGRVPHDELAAYYRAASAACLVSEHEGFGLSALEAMACGTPVVVSRTAPVAQIVEHLDRGAVVDPLDVDDIARGLRHAARMPHCALPAAHEVLNGRTTRYRAGDVVDITRAALARDRI